MAISDESFRAAVNVSAPRLVDNVRRFASVAMVLRSHPTPRVLIMRRADNPSDRWSGQLAFPGGRRDPEDVDLLATAMRETLEEVGVRLTRKQCLGRIDDVAPATGGTDGMCISTFVFLSGHDGPFLLDPNEAAEAMWVELEPLINGTVDTTHRFQHLGQQRELPAFQIGDKPLWGLTYWILTSFLARLSRVQTA